MRILLTVAGKGQTAEQCGCWVGPDLDDCDDDDYTKED